MMQYQNLNVFPCEFMTSGFVGAPDLVWKMAHRNIGDITLKHGEEE